MLPGIKQFDLGGRTAIITGGSKGLGQAMAAGLASAGASVMLVSRTQDQADAVASAIASDFGVKALGHVADVTDQAATQAMVARAIEELGQIDILINSAGINIRGAIDEVTLEEFKQVQDIKDQQQHEQRRQQLLEHQQLQRMELSRPVPTYSFINRRWD